MADTLRRRRGTGAPLPSDVAERFGEQLGADLSGVRVHADAEADQISRSVQATAFTHGTDVYFTQGSYAPHSQSGQHLLAHELAHVMQQGGGSNSGAVIGRADDPAEASAEATAARVVGTLRRRAATTRSSTAPARPAVGPEHVSQMIHRYTFAELKEKHARAITESAQSKGGSGAKDASAPVGNTAAKRANFGPPVTPAVLLSVVAEVPTTKPHRSWLVAKLKEDYKQERTTPNPGLRGAVNGFCTDIKKSWQALEDLSGMDPADDVRLNEIKERFRIAGPHGPGALFTALTPMSRDEARAKIDERYQRLLEIAKREEIPVSADGTLADISGRKVEYDETADKQEKTKVLFGGGKMHRNDGPKTLVDTKDSVTHHSGLGVEIFVVSANNEIHMASHKIGKYHHSSLLAGQDVSMGGEMKVTAGKIDWMSNKSGHYNPSATHFVQFLSFLKKDGLDMSFQVQGWGVDAGLTAQQFLDGLDKNMVRNEKKSAEFLKTDTVWKGFCDEFGAAAVLGLINAQHWVPNGAGTGYVDTAGIAVPHAIVRKLLKQTFGKKAKVRQEQAQDATLWNPNPDPKVAWT
ncbi:MAG TPA: DUF4157 domain-containing protein [Jatrophihabitantaceae bacterium]|nr:DUF4157 domain-containing protein [Jatrophihabitantaceae bacterium]